ncbi:monocarboxylate transporter 12 [Elysia marginata]|uniref:Monocarboxylate transporter 12 n=1 Tax=Elysia marginata TaxID=1093978 RepID=A0AAV4H9I2_9GAST|nr:monocarboxylate transporter 12 [Elysia marginata]
MCQLTRFFNTFPTLVAMSSIIGIFIGTRISMMPLVCIEVVGVEMMPQAWSIVQTIGTLSAAAMNPTLGAVADSFGNFVPVLHILGVFFFISASILMMLPLGHKMDKRREHSDNLQSKI